MEEQTGLCQLCRKAKFKYTCPKCNIMYCSVQCYRSPAHTRCSEEFYRDCCMKEELHRTASGSNSDQDLQKMYNILRRIREAEAGMKPEDFDSDTDSENDNKEGDTASDQDNTQLDETADNDGGNDDGDCEDEDDIAIRLQGVNLNNAEEVWARLTDVERENFQKMVDSGDIMKLVPTYQPWWVSIAAERKRQTSKIVELPTKDNANNLKIPEIANNIPNFSTIFHKEPSPCIHYNIWNILTAYACVVRHFNGDHLTDVNILEAAAELIKLSATLKYGTNFEDADDAIVSVEMEALVNSNAGQMNGFIVESREQLQEDARQLMITQQCKSAAMSDVLRCLQLARNQLKAQRLSAIGSKKTNNVVVNDNDRAKLEKLLVVCSGSIELTPRKLLELAKKIEFYLAYVQRDDSQTLN